MIDPGFPRLRTIPSLAMMALFTQNLPSGESLGEGWAMSASRSGNWRAVWAIGAALAVPVIPGSAWAYTAEQQQACMSDAFRLCSSEIPSIDRITACMAQHKSQLSPPCRAQFTSAPGPAASDEGSDEVTSATAHKRYRSHRARRPRADLD